MRPKTIIATLALAGVATLPVTSSATGLGSQSSAAYGETNMQSGQAFDHGRHHEGSQQLGAYMNMDPALQSDMTFDTSTLQRTWYHPDGTVVYQYPEWTIVGHAGEDPFSASSGSSFDESAQSAAELGDEGLDGIERSESFVTEPSISSGESSDAISRFSGELSSESDATLLGGPVPDDAGAAGGASFESNVEASGFVSEENADQYLLGETMEHPDASSGTSFNAAAELPGDIGSESVDLTVRGEPGLDEPSASSGASMDSAVEADSGFNYGSAEPAIPGQSGIDESSGSEGQSYGYGSSDELSSESGSSGSDDEISSHSASEPDSIGSDWRVS
jgi:hypothetical protein